MLDGCIQMELSITEVSFMYNSFIFAIKVAGRVVLMHSLSIARTVFEK